MVCFRHNQRFSQVSNHQERTHKLAFLFYYYNYYYYCYNIFSKGLILPLCRQICVPGDFGYWIRLQNWPFFLILQGKNACLWSTNRTDEKEPCAQGGTGSNVELIYLLSLIKCSLFLEILLYKSHQWLTAVYSALWMRNELHGLSISNMVVLLLTSHGKLQVRLPSLRKRLCAVLTTELAFDLRYFHPLEHALWKGALSVEVCVTTPAALSKLPVCSALLTLKQYFVTRDTDPQSRICNVKAEEKRDCTITVRAIYGNPNTGNWYFRPEGKWGHYLGM